MARSRRLGVLFGHELVLGLQMRGGRGRHFRSHGRCSGGDALAGVTSLAGHAREPAHVAATLFSCVLIAPILFIELDAVGNTAAIG
jgi:hypothetical protein